MNQSNCPNCGSSVTPSTDRCGYCGTWFREPEESPAPIEQDSAPLWPSLVAVAIGVAVVALLMSFYATTSEHPEYSWSWSPLGWVMPTNTPSPTMTPIPEWLWAAHATFTPTPTATPAHLGIHLETGQIVVWDDPWTDHGIERGYYEYDSYWRHATAWHPWPTYTPTATIAWCAKEATGIAQWTAGVPTWTPTQTPPPVWNKDRVATFTATPTNTPWATNTPTPTPTYTSTPK